LKKETVQYSDDFTGVVSDDVKRYAFGWMGNYFEIDMSDETLAKWKPLLDELAAHAHPIKPKKVRSNDKERLTKEDYKPIRDWAKQQGMPVGDKGRIRKSVLDAYREAHS
jgi:hypothetical protein